MKLVVMLTLMFSLVSCQSNNITSKADYPKTDDQKTVERMGKITGEGFKFGGKKSANEAVGITVNGFLWRASLDTVSFMPLVSADPFGGVIITDWYSMPESTNERYKMTIVISSKNLRSDGVRVSLFKQAFKQANWHDVSIEPAMVFELEETILAKARALRIQNS